MTIGQRIKAARKNAGLTQKELGQRLGVAYQTLAQWENDLRKPKMETLERIADALGVPISEICSKDVLKNYEILKRSRENSRNLVQETKDILEQYALALRQQEAIKVLGGEKIERFVYAMNDLNNDGQWKVVNHAVDYAHDLAKIPEYQRECAETAPQSPSTQVETDTTPAPDAPEGAEEAE